MLVADEMGLRKTLPSVAVAMICQEQTEKVLVGLLLSILWENSHDKWVNMT